MKIKHNEHVFIAGMTQSGKTYLMKQFLAHEPTTVFVLATKGVFNWDQVPEKEQSRVYHLRDIAKPQTKKVIYEPVFEELTQENYDEFFKFCYQRAVKKHKTIVVVDEAMQVCPTPHKIPLWYKGILTRGMELGVSVWSLTQRPSNIPIVLLTEATHYFIFKLNAISDRKRLVEYTGYKEFLEIPQGHDFWYFNTITGKPPVMARLGGGDKNESKSNR